MSFCSINDAFNINANFEKTIRGLSTNSFMPAVEELDSLKTSKFDTLTCINAPYDAPYADQNKKFNINQMTGMDCVGDCSLSNLNGTTLEYSKFPKLTHRDCISIYTNPDRKPDDQISQALKHISRCQMCKDEIKKNISSSNVESFSSACDCGDDDYSKNKPVKKESTPNLGSSSGSGSGSSSGSGSNFATNSTASSKSEIESELKKISEKINEESNIKYQNAMIQNNLSKYLEDMQEKKQVNEKIDKILDLLNVNATQLNQICSLTQVNKNNIYSEIRPENNIYSENRPDNYYKNLSNNILNSLTNLTSSSNSSNLTGSSNSSNFNTEFSWVNIGIVMVIALLIIDIVLRMTGK
jgi:uncharacterized membrane protein YgcG